MGIGVRVNPTNQLKIPSRADARTPLKRRRTQLRKQCGHFFACRCACNLSNAKYSNQLQNVRPTPLGATTNLIEIRTENNFESAHAPKVPNKSMQVEEDSVKTMECKK